MSKHRTSQIELSLDSLLDTLFNVVGMLVIILLAVQLSASETIREFTRNRQIVNQEELDEARVKAEKLEKKLDFKRRIHERMQKLKQRKLQMLQDVASLRKQAEDIRKRNYDNIAKSREKDELIKEVDKIEKQIREQENILATLMAKNSKTDIELRVPVVRTASKRMESKIFFCKWGKLYSFNMDTLTKTLNKGLRESGKDLRRLKAWMNNYDRGVENFRYSIDTIGTRGGYQLELLAAVEPRSNSGWSIDEIKKPNSKYTQMIRQLDKNKHVVRFFVLSDSYLVYLEARRIAEEHSLKAGWEPYEKDKKILIYYGSGAGGKTRTKYD
jgi:hypothetical protein